MIDLYQHPQGEILQGILKEISGQSSVPNVWINGNHIGGNDACHALDAEGKLLPLETGGQFSVILPSKIFSLEIRLKIIGIFQMMRFASLRRARLLPVAAAVGCAQLNRKLHFTPQKIAQAKRYFGVLKFESQLSNPHY